jgi:predicted dehydrogenase
MPSPPLRLNRRRFLGCSAAASLALSQTGLAEAGLAGEASAVRLGVVGVGSRGTQLVRTLLELPGVSIVALADLEAKHRLRGQGIVEKASGVRPEAFDDPRLVYDRADVDAVVVALPCDQHEDAYRDAIRAGKHLYAEKPLAITLPACDRLIAEAERSPGVLVHVGFQRRSNPRFREGIELIRRGELGPLIEARASWTSSNGPMTGSQGWLARRERSGDWMVEQAVHIWDVLHGIAGGAPVRAIGWGRRNLFTRNDPGRDVTDHYSVELEWADGFRASFVQSWVMPADDGFAGTSLRVVGEAGGLDFHSGTLTYRDRDRPRRSIQPGPQADTRLALAAFLDDVRRARSGSATADPAASSSQPEPAASLASLVDARAATLTGLLVRKAVDERRLVSLDEIQPEDA